MMAAFNIAKRQLLPPRRLGARDILNKSRFEAVVNTSGFSREALRTFCRCDISV
jgi:hypothetical protein